MIGFYTNWFKGTDIHFKENKTKTYKTTNLNGVIKLHKQQPDTVELFVNISLFT